MRYLLCLFCLTTLCVSAQDSLRQRPHQLSLLLGPGKLISQDEMISPLRYRGTSAVGQLSYRFISRRNFHTVSLSFSAPSLTTEVDFTDRRHGPTDALLSQLAYEYQRMIYSRSWFQVWAGAKTGLTVLYKHPQLVNTIVTGDAVTSLSPTIAVGVVPSERHHLRWHVSYPVVSNVVGGSYGFAFGEIPLSEDITPADVLRQNSWFAPHQLVDIQSTLTYEYALAARWSFCTAYAFRYWQYRRPLLIRSATHIWQIGISYGL